MKDKKKNTDSKENQKRLFLRMKSPSAFGAARRFDSASFMNVPPEMARRDAAYSRFSAFFLTCDFTRQSASERSRIYGRMVELLILIAEKTEFILHADSIEKRHLENIENIAYIRLLQKYFNILNHLAGMQMNDEKEEESIPSGDFQRQQEPNLHHCEESLLEIVRTLVKQTHPLLAAQKEQRCKLFSKSDSERYERAYSFYLEYYSELKQV